MDTRSIAAEAIAAHHAMQDENELALLLAYMNTDVRPANVLEIGGGAGGSAWAFSQVSWVKKIVTITLPGKGLVNEAHAVDHLVIYGNSTSPATAAQVPSTLWPKMVLIDGGHDAETVRSDWALYGPMCVTNGIVVFHDTRTEPGVRDLWEELRHQHASVELAGQCGTGILWPGKEPRRARM